MTALCCFGICYSAKYDLRIVLPEPGMTLATQECRHIAVCSETAADQLARSNEQ